MPNSRTLPNQGSQYQNQNAYRTINMAFIPYFPETQRYRMELDSQFTGNRSGYFSLRPQPYAGGKKESKLPWNIRMDSYDARAPTGRLSSLNTYSRKRAAVESAEILPAMSESSRLGQEMRDILSADNGRAGRNHDINTANEVELAMLGREIENFLNVGVSQNITNPRGRPGSLSPQSLDLLFEENLGLAEGLEQINVSTAGALGIEVTSAAPESKRLSHMRQAVGNLNTTRTTFDNHVRNEIRELNVEIVNRLSGPAVAQDRRGTIPLGPGATDEQRLMETARSRFHMGAAGTMDSFARRLLSRQSEVIQGDLASNVAVDSFLEQVNLRGDFQGIASFRGYVVDINGTPTPQFEVAYTTVLHGSTLYEAIHQEVVRNLSTTNQTLFNRATATIGETAINDAYRLPAREAMLGTFQDASYHIDSIYGLGLYVGEAPSNKGKMGLTSTEIAEGLRVQIETMFSAPATQQQFANWYSEMMRASNKLTEQWKAAVPDGRVHGASISREWTYGDGFGNPHKKYLGIWGPRGEDAYPDGERIGYNVSMSPFLTSRREGTVLFNRS